MTSPTTTTEPERVTVPAEVYQQQRDRAQREASEWEAAALVLRAERDAARAECEHLQARADATGAQDVPSAPGLPMCQDADCVAVHTTNTPCTPTTTVQENDA